MSYQPPPPGWGQPGQQQPGWGQQQQYPPQQPGYHPQQQQQAPYGYAPPPPQAPYGQPPYQGYAPPAQGQAPGYHAPPPGQYPQQPYGGYPPQQSPAYGQQPYGHPPAPGYPPQPHGHPPQPQAHPQPHSQYPPQGAYPPAPPPGGQYASPPQPQAAYGAPPGAAPSPGYDPHVEAYTDMTYPAQQLREAMAGVGTNEKKLIEVLSQVPDPAHMLKLRHTYDDRFRRSLLRDLEQETGGHFRAGLAALCRGPLLEDAHLVHAAVNGVGTKENLLNTIVLGRSNADLNAIKLCFSQVYKRDLAREISDDLSLKTEQLFKYVLQAARAEEAAPVLPHDVEANTDRLYSATEAHRGMSTNQDEVCKIMAYSSDGMIRAIDLRYKAKYHKSLDDLYKAHFTGHMRDALRLMAARAIDPVKSDADQIEAAMHGMGTRDDLLIERIVKAHWNKDHWRQVKIAYQKFHNKSMSDRVHGETSGDYRRLLLALVG